MKQKLTITVDAELLPKAKRYARSRVLCDSVEGPVSSRWP